MQIRQSKLEYISNIYTEIVQAFFSWISYHLQSQCILKIEPSAKIQGQAKLLAMTSDLRGQHRPITRLNKDLELPHGYQSQTFQLSSFVKMHIFFKSNTWTLQQIFDSKNRVERLKVHYRGLFGESSFLNDMNSFHPSIDPLEFPNDWNSCIIVFWFFVISWLPNTNGFLANLWGLCI